jgi:hypothetical protein
MDWWMNDRMDNERMDRWMDEDERMERAWASETVSRIR